MHRISISFLQINASQINHEKVEDCWVQTCPLTIFLSSAMPYNLMQTIMWIKWVNCFSSFSSLSCPEKSKFFLIIKAYTNIISLPYQCQFIALFLNLWQGFLIHCKICAQIPIHVRLLCKKFVSHGTVEALVVSMQTISMKRWFLLIYIFIIEKNLKNSGQTSQEYG